MAKFGFLYINQGNWDGKQVVPKKWVLESLKNYGEGYGYHVWITQIKNFDGFMAAGYGGQFIVGFPELDLIIVITSNAQLGRWRNPSYIIDKLLDYL
jgi:CubicO group peptidase (beta-lactamase class C family)